MRVCSVGATRVLAIGLVALVAVVGCQPEQRPAAGSVRTIGTPSSGSATGSVSGSVSAPAPGSAASPQNAPSPTGVASAALAAASPTLLPSKSDGIYTPTTNREIYQAISADYQEIVASPTRSTMASRSPQPRS